jgi:hypothetical protein
MVMAEVTAESVCVALKIRPLSLQESDEGCRESIVCAPGTNQVREY